MKIHHGTLSFEFYPPKTAEGAEKLRAVRAQLAPLDPAFFSVTYGAGGSTREGSLAAVMDIHSAGLPVAPHLSCVGSSRAALSQLLGQFRDAGIRRIVALRGDLPSGAAGGSGEFNHASDLVSFIRRETGDWFHIEVACYPEVHPQARSPQEDLRHFIGKVRAGADSAITQYFYNADAYFRFVDDAAKLGCVVPIVPGIMPITNYSQLARFSDGCGAEIPRWVRRRLEACGDDRAAIRSFGLDVVTRLCETLLRGGAPGMHVYTMNMAESTLELNHRLGSIAHWG